MPDAHPLPKLPISEAAKIFGQRVRERRHELGLSQEHLAEGTSLQWSFIGRIERGQANLTLHNILRLAQALSIDRLNSSGVWPLHPTGPDAWRYPRSTLSDLESRGVPPNSLTLSRVAPRVKPTTCGDVCRTVGGPP